MAFCPTCKQEIKSKRSVEISDRFHGWVTYIARELAMDRNRVYYEVLLLAIEIECEGGKPYPYAIVPRIIVSPITLLEEEIDLPEPLRTGNRTNKEMMTACRACEIYAASRGLTLPEKEEE
jgi:hypothetical protein